MTQLVLIQKGQFHTVTVNDYDTSMDMFSFATRALLECYDESDYKQLITMDINKQIGIIGKICPCSNSETDRTTRLLKNLDIFREARSMTFPLFESAVIFSGFMNDGLDQSPNVYGFATGFIEQIKEIWVQC
jgi:hypothetical protein